jgi:Predicted metal-dependent hydrolase of the TIM-barrel fold
MTSHPFEQMLSIVSIISNGVLDRFPKLKVGFLEAGVGFLPYWMERFDEKYLLRKSEMEPLKLLPSEYIKDHRCYFTCEGEESALPLVIEQFGDECMMYASDYPHWDMEWPHSVSQVVRRKDVSDQTKQKFSRTMRKRSTGLHRRSESEKISYINDCHLEPFDCAQGKLHGDPS